MVATRDFTVFIGGPDDVHEEHVSLHRLVLHLADHYHKRVRLVPKHWNLGSEAILAPAGINFQSVIDSRMRAAACDVVFLLFRGRLGSPDHHDGREYPSSSAYELESALSSGKSAVFVLRDSQWKPSLPSNVVELPEEHSVAKFREIQAQQAEFLRLNQYLVDLRDKRPNVVSFDSTDQLLALANRTLAAELEKLGGNEIQALPVIKKRNGGVGNPFRSFSSLTDLENAIFLVEMRTCRRF